MIKVHALVPEKGDGTSWYRGAGPLRALEREHPDKIQLKVFDNSQQFEWYDLDNCDVLVLQRPFSANCLNFFSIGKMFKAKVICDWDDSFDDIHVSNATYDIYNQDSVKQVVAALRKMSAVQWTTTEHLKKKLDRDAGCEKTIVIPNAWQDVVFDTFKEPGTNNTIHWRGGSGHEKDLLMFTDGIVEFSRKFPLWSYVLSGDKAWPWLEALPKEKVQRVGWAPTPLFIKNFMEMQPGIVVVPLHDMTFNYSKSSNSWMEAAAAGAVSVVPDWPEWQKPGTFRYKNREDFFNKLKEAASTPRKVRAEMVSEAQDYIKEHLLLSKVNKLRLESIERLASESEVDKYIRLRVKADLGMEKSAVQAEAKKLREENK